MIIQIIGKVKYPITLDPTVWIFDDRKILFDSAFDDDIQEDEIDELKDASERFAREYFIKPPVNKSISKFDRNQILENTYVIPIKDFINNAEINDNAQQVIIDKGDEQEIITIEQLTSCLLLFAKEGKPIKEDGPVHLYFKDGSNKDNPIKSVKKIIID